MSDSTAAHDDQQKDCQLTTSLIVCVDENQASGSGSGNIEGEKTPTRQRSLTPTPASTAAIALTRSAKAKELKESFGGGNKVQGRERHKSFSIHSLIEEQGNSAAQSNAAAAKGEIPAIRKEAPQNMDFAVFNLQPHPSGTSTLGSSSISMPDHHLLESPNASLTSLHAIITPSTTSTSDIDNESLAALADASKAAGLQHERHPDMASSEGITSSLSPYAAAGDSRASSALSIATTFSSTYSDEASGRHSAPQMNLMAESSPAQLGRTRSDTARRYGSLVSAGSAPAQLGEKSVGELSLSSGGSMSSLLRSPSASSSGEAGLKADDEHDEQGISMYAGNQGDVSGSSARKKRNKCSPEQFRQLESFFAKNRNPTGKVREELAKRIQMPERSVQVWFQNKRAKTKIAEIKEGIPQEQRSTVSKSKSQARASSSSEPSTSGRRAKKTVTQSATLEESVIQLPVTSLMIGQWRRIKPLICIFSRRNQSFTWFLSSESVGFKLDCPRTSIKRILFTGPREPTVHEFSEGVHQPIGSLLVELDRPPQFYMEVFRSGGSSTGSTGKDGEQEQQQGQSQQGQSQQGQSQQQQQQRASWRQCSDFTEGKEATSVFTHIVSGPFVTLRQALIQLRESNGSIAQLVEFQDSQTSEQAHMTHSLQENSSPIARTRTGEPVNQDSTPSAHMLHLDARHLQPSHAPMDMPFGLSGEGHGESQMHYAAPSWSQQHAWPQDYTASLETPSSAATVHQASQQQQDPHFSQQHFATTSNALGSQHQLNTGQAYFPNAHSPHHLQVDAGKAAMSAHSAPQSASSIDLSALRIDTAGIQSLDAVRSLEVQQSIAADAQSLVSPMNAHGTPQWPHTASAHSASGWLHAGATPTSRIHTIDGTHLHPASMQPHIASAPAYAMHSFEVQQQQSADAMQQLHPHGHQAPQQLQQQMYRFPPTQHVQMQIQLPQQAGTEEHIGTTSTALDANDDLSMTHHRAGTDLSSAPSEETVTSFGSLPYHPHSHVQQRLHPHGAAAATYHQQHHSQHQQAANSSNAQAGVHSATNLFSQPSHVAAAAEAAGFTHHGGSGGSVMEEHEGGQQGGESMHRNV